MKNMIVFATFLIFALSVVGFLGSAMAAQTKPMQMVGQVVSVDPAAKSLVTKDEKGQMSFNIGDKTHVMMGKEHKTLADLKAGDKVEVKYTQVEGKSLAESVKKM